MRKGDDRPRPSEPKKKTEPEGAAPSVKCCLCGFLFDPDAEQTRIRNDGSVVCRNERACRGRILDAEIGKELKGDAWRDGDRWLFAKFPRDLMLQLMDIRPVRWKALRWVPRFDLWVRVLACILYHSWSYPVCYAYAVQLRGTCPLAGRDDPDPDDFVVDEYGRAKRLRVGDIGRILNEQWQGNNGNVPRALKCLKDRKLIRVDDDHVIWPAAKLADMSIAERISLYAMAPELVDPIVSEVDRLELQAFLKQLRSVPKRFRAQVLLIRHRCPDDNVRSEVLTGIWEDCSAFNHTIRRARTQRDSAIEEKCSRGTYLIPELVESFRSSSSPQPLLSPIAPKPSSVSAGDDERVPLNEPCASGLGTGARAKLSPEWERDAELIRTCMMELTGNGEKHVADQLILRVSGSGSRYHGGRDCGRHSRESPLRPAEE